MRRRRAAVRIFGEELVRQTEEDPAPAELPTEQLRALVAVARHALPLGTQAWLMRVRTWTAEQSLPVRLAVVRMIVQGRLKT